MKFYDVAWNSMMNPQMVNDMARNGQAFVFRLMFHLLGKLKYFSMHYSMHYISHWMLMYFVICHVLSNQFCGFHCKHDSLSIYQEQHFYVSLKDWLSVNQQKSIPTNFNKPQCLINFYFFLKTLLSSQATARSLHIPYLFPNNGCSLLYKLLQLYINCFTCTSCVM